jgi:hypothetical protein
VQGAANCAGTCSRSIGVFPSPTEKAAKPNFRAARGARRVRNFYLAVDRSKLFVLHRFWAVRIKLRRMRDATVSARAIVPEARELNNLLIGVATEIANTVDNLLGDLDRRIEALRASDLNGSSELPLAELLSLRTHWQDSDCQHGNDQL